MINNNCIFAPRKTPCALLDIDYSFEFTIIYLSGLYLYSTLERFFLFN